MVEFDDVRAGRVGEAERDAIRSAGCVVLRGTFDPAEAEAWDDELGRYLADNVFQERFLVKHPGAATPRGSGPCTGRDPQVAARQHDRMSEARRFLNRLWSFESGGERWFDPDHDIGYPDRIRRREPGAESKGLAAHADSPSVGGWRIAENQAVFAPLLRDGPRCLRPVRRRLSHGYAGRVSGRVARSSGRSRVGPRSRRCDPGDGVLHVVPIPAAVGYRLVHGLAGELGLLGDEPVPAPRAMPPTTCSSRRSCRSRPSHRVTRCGGTATCTTRSATLPTTRGWGNVMYIGAAPRCPRNEACAATTFDRFVRGASPVDYPADDFEIEFEGRATADDLN